MIGTPTLTSILHSFTKTQKALIALSKKNYETMRETASKTKRLQRDYDRLNVENERIGRISVKLQELVK